jgi:hypothetical protein
MQAMTRPGGATWFVGRDQPRRRLVECLHEAGAGRSRLALVTGEAGMGKTALVAYVLEEATPAPLAVWGTCWADAAAPGYWPWTQALNALSDRIGRAAALAAAADDAPVLASVVTALGPTSQLLADTDPVRTRLLFFDAVGRWLTALAADRPFVVVLDDVQWADRSSLDLLDHLSRALHGVGVLLVGTCREDELPAELRAVMTGLTSRAEHIALEGLTAADVYNLVRELAGAQVADARSASIHQRTGGRPFFVREITAVVTDETGDQSLVVPSAVYDLVGRRLDRLSPGCRKTLTVAALMGNDVRPDILATAMTGPPDAVQECLDEARAVAVLKASAGGGVRFAHDLIRETLTARLPAAARSDVHLRIAVALEEAGRRGAPVPAAEPARHYAEAVSLDGYERAIRWAVAAADADRARLAFTEAAQHLERAREATTRAGVTLPGRLRVDLMVAEADAVARAGDPDRARSLLATARGHARDTADPARLAAVAFGVQRLGARFAMPREPVIEVLDEARRAAIGRVPTLEATLTAALARELAHSVPQHRARAGPLSERALELARATTDAGTELACLLARHDVVWTPGTGAERGEISRRIVDLAEQRGDDEARAEGLLLLANALLETGSPTFRDTLRVCLNAVDALGQPRHRYLALTRRAALSLMDGDLGAAAALIDDATVLGERIREPDTGNVRMSQRLALVALRGNPDEQRGFAAEAVAWWVGAPVHAHCVAAGFLARAGDLDAARREIDIVNDLGGWRADRSYLWSVFIGQLAEAAVLLHDEALSENILHDLRPVHDVCGVNGAVVAFAGALAHPAGLVAAATGRVEEARTLLQYAVDVHVRLGDPLWEAASRTALAALGDTPASSGMTTLRRTGNRWTITHGTRTATVPDTRGWRDLAVLLDRPGEDVHVLQLVDSGLLQQPAGELADRTAIAAYRRRLHDLDREQADAEHDNDLGRAERLRAERDALLAEVGRVTGRGGRPRPDPGGAAERARKAVTARIRDAIKRLEPELPDLAAHLNRNIITGSWCRYRPDPSVRWTVRS